MTSYLEKPVSEYSSLFHPYMGDDEVVLWSGKPPGGIKFQAMDIIAVTFSFFWLAAVFFIATNGGPPLLFLLPFMAIGFYITVGRFIWDYRRRSHTYYAVSNRNAYILTRGRREKCQTLFLQKMTSIRVEAWHDGGGNIIFDQAAHPESNSPFTWTWNNRLSPPPVFEKIANVRQVYHLIRRAQAETPEQPVLSTERRHRAR